MKKLLIILATSMVALSAQALDQNSSWDEILGEYYNYAPKFPQYALSHGYFVTTPSVCIDGAYLRTKVAKEKCTDYSGRDGDCRATEMVFPRRKISGTRTVCTEWRGPDNDCVKTRQVPYRINTSPMIAVYSVNRNSSGPNSDHSPYGRFLFNKEFVIPNCQ